MVITFLYPGAAFHQLPGVRSFFFTVISIRARRRHFCHDCDMRKIFQASAAAKERSKK